MEIVIRIIAFILTRLGVLLNQLLQHWVPSKKPNFPPITDPVLTKSVIELVTELRRGQVSSKTGEGRRGDTFKMRNLNFAPLPHAADVRAGG